MDGFPLITWIGSQLGPAVDGNSGGSTDLGPTASGNGSRAGGKKTACAPPGAKGGWSGGRYYRRGGNRDGSPSRRASSQGEQPDGAARPHLDHLRAALLLAPACRSLPPALSRQDPHRAARAWPSPRRRAAARGGGHPRRGGTGAGGAVPRRDDTRVEVAETRRDEGVTAMGLGARPGEEATARVWGAGGGGRGPPSWVPAEEATARIWEVAAGFDR